MQTVLSKISQINSTLLILGGGEEFREFEEEILDDLEEEIDYDDDIWGENEESDDGIEDDFSEDDDDEDEGEFDDLEEIDDFEELDDLDDIDEFDEDSDDGDFEEEDWLVCPEPDSNRHDVAIEGF